MPSRMKPRRGSLAAIAIAAVVLALTLALAGCAQSPIAASTDAPDAPTTQSAAGPLDESKLFEDTVPTEQEAPATVDALAFDSDGSTLYGQIMVPSENYGDNRPCVIMFHGFAGFTRMDDVAQALCRAGAVVMVPHHRGAWGSEGSYSFSHCIEDAVNLAEYAHSDEFCSKYGVDPDSIVLFGHSMGGNTVLNAAAQLDFVRAVVLAAPCDISRLYLSLSDDDLRKFLVDNGAEALRTDGLDALVADVAENADKWQFPHAVSRVDAPIMIATGELDTVCPADQMVDPLTEALEAQERAFLCERRDYDADHTLAAARVQLTRDVAAFIDESCS